MSALTSVMELIDLSDNSSASDIIDLSEESYDDVIEICEINESKNYGQYDSIFKESKLLGEFIEKCFDLENTKGMIRVINRSLIPAYYSTRLTFRRSEIFTSIISKSIRKLDSDPNHKFSHVKELCVEMKRSSQKMEDKILNKTKYPKRIKRKKKIKWPIRKKRTPNETDNIILSDDSSSFEVPIINLDEYTCHENDTGMPLGDFNGLNQQVEYIEVDIDNMAQDPGLTNGIEVTDKDCPTSNADLGKENFINNSSTQATLKNETRNTVSGENSTEAHLNNKKDDSSLEVSAKRIQDINLNTLGGQSNKDTTKNDTEISSTEISSTVNVYENYDVDVKAFQDCDLMVLDQDEKEFVTTTQNVNIETNNVTGLKVHSEEKIKVLPDDTCRKSNKQDDDSIVLDEDDDQKPKLTKKLCEGKDNENRNNKANNITSKDTISPLIACKIDKSITGSVVNDLIVLDEDEETEVKLEVKQITQQQDKQISIVNNASLEEKKIEAKSKEPVQSNCFIVIDDEDDSEKIACHDNVGIPHSSPINDDNKLLVPHKAIAFEGTTEDTIMTKIKIIEDEIAACKARVTELEEEEVIYDSMSSPYIQCEKYKEKIVSLYKELCKLTGQRAVKRREVRLKAANTRSQLCVDKLEDLINKNIGGDGLPHFPDFQDVLQCVRAANIEGDLGWNRSEVLGEANVLFTYCGRALQESRKRREWRDMMSLVKSELIEDPADSDPDLMARLQANKETAVKKEKDLLERYTEMSYLPPSTECTKENYSHSDSENDVENEVEQETKPIQDTANVTSQFRHNTVVTDQNTINEYKAMEVISQKLVNGVLNKTSSNSNGLTETHKVEKDTSKIASNGSHVKRKRCTPIKLDDATTARHAFMTSFTKTPKVSSKKDPKNIINHNFNLIAKVVLQRMHLPTTPGAKISCKDLHYLKSEGTKTNESDSTKHLINEVKKEPVDIQEELDKLGNNFTTTVIDIEDPCLIVEISSDSEDEDDNFTSYVSYL